MSQFTQDYKDIILDVGYRLNNNDEWVSRYKGYTSAINGNSFYIKQASHAFGFSPNLDIYLSTSKAKQANSRTVFFDARYKGQNVAELRIRDTDVFIRCHTDHNKKYYSEYPLELVGIPKSDEIDWKSPEAINFRKYFASSPSRMSGNNLEHSYESQLLRQFSMTTSKGKYLSYIQPITLLGNKFQMPTPIKASGAKDGKLDYSKDKGGGIDILARQGRGEGISLTVIELKDECNAIERPEKAIKQAIAYATFLQKLLRTPEADSKGWWSFFGFNGIIPAFLKIQTVIAMPRGNYNDKSFAMEKLVIPNSNDYLELHYLYFDVDNNNITGIEDTSLKG